MSNASEISVEEIAERSSAAMMKADEAVRHLGIRLERISPGGATMTMTVLPNMANGHGTCHGGFIFALADSAFAYAANSYNGVAVAQNCTITYVNPAHTGNRLTATAREVSRRGRSGVYDVDVSDEHGQQIALFRGHSRNINGKHVELPE